MNFAVGGLGESMLRGAETFGALAGAIEARRDERLRGALAVGAGGASGGAVTVALRNLDRYANGLLDPESLARDVARVLAQYGALHQQVDDMVGALVRFYGKEAASGPVALLRAIGETIDFMCARHIDALCTPAGTPPPARLEDFNGVPVAAIHQLHMATASADVVALATRYPEMRILEASDGRLVAMVPPPGMDLDVLTEPANVTTFVNGVGSSAPHMWGGSLERARTMAAATGGPVVAWLGYNAPPTLAHGVAGAPATTAGAELARFQQGLAARYPDARHVVVGYSYGSLVAGNAARGDGLRADELVIVGSPGVGVNRAAELRVIGGDGLGRVHAVTATGDPIALTTSTVGGLHGADPAGLGFNAKPWPTRLHGDHGSYFADPDFLKHLGTVAQG